MIKAVLFDLDGTLLPMDQDLFTKTYFKYLAAKLAPLGYDSKQLIDGIWQGTAAMVKSDGKDTNEKVFWASFCQMFGEKAYADLPVFEEFYATDFNKAKQVCSLEPQSAITVKWLKERGIRVTLASNPIFPMVAQTARIGWAGLEISDFEHITSYENSRFCKPNPNYYSDIVTKLGVKAEECLMVGNDVDEDMVAATLNMKVFLIEKCVINRHGKDFSVYPHGDFEKLREYIAAENNLTL